MAIIDRFPLPSETIWKKYSIKTTYYWNKYNRSEKTTYYWDKCNITEVWQESRTDEEFKGFSADPTMYSSYTLITDPANKNAGMFYVRNGERLTGGITHPASMANSIIEKKIPYTGAGQGHGGSGEMWYTNIKYFHDFQVGIYAVKGIVTIISAIKVKQKGNRIGEVTSSTSNLYPQDGEKDSFWYTFNRQVLTYIKGSSYYGQVSSTSSTTYPNNSYSGSYWYVYSGAVQSSGSYIGEVSSDDENAFPANGAKNGYWYIKVE